MVNAISRPFLCSKTGFSAAQSQARSWSSETRSQSESLGILGTLGKFIGTMKRVALVFTRSGRRHSWPVATMSGLMPNSPASRIALSTMSTLPGSMMTVCPFFKTA